MEGNQVKSNAPEMPLSPTKGGSTTSTTRRRKYEDDYDYSNGKYKNHRRYGDSYDDDDVDDDRNRNANYESYNKHKIDDYKRRDYRDVADSSRYYRSSRDSKRSRHRYDDEYYSRKDDRSYNKRYKDDDRYRRHRRYRSKSRSRSHNSKSKNRIHRRKSESSPERIAIRSQSQEKINSKPFNKSTSQNDCDEHTINYSNLSKKNDGQSKTMVTCSGTDKTDSITNNQDTNEIIYDDGDNTLNGYDFDKERIHQEMQERLREHLAKEGKIYPPPPKQQASHPIFANDGSFLETFKRFHELQQHCGNTEMENYLDVEQNKPVQQQSYVVPQTQPFGKRRGVKILKTGIVEKPKPIPEKQIGTKPKDAWSLYLEEVQKYKNVTCDADEMAGEIVLQTAPFDPRFPNTNQTRYCYQSFLDFHRCQKKRGKDYEPCQYFFKTYKSMCPNAWVDKWNEQLDAGTFPGRI